MEIEIDGMKLTMDPKRAVVRVELPSGGHIEKQGITEVLLFLLLAKAQKTK